MDETLISHGGRNFLSSDTSLWHYSYERSRSGGGLDAAAASNGVYVGTRVAGFPGEAESLQE